MLIVVLLSWLLLVVPFTLVVARGIALGTRCEDGAAYPLELPTQVRAPQPALAELSA